MAEDREENVKVKIDPATGAVEIEGPEAFVRDVLDRYRELASAARPGDPSAGVKRRTRSKRKQAQTAIQAKPARKGGRLELDEKLKGELQEKRKALIDYFGKRKVTTQVDEAAIIAGFLAAEMKRSTMNKSEYLTVLRVMGTKLPKNPAQVLLDAKNKKGYFHEEGEALALTTTGLNFVEHDSLKKDNGG